MPLRLGTTAPSAIMLGATEATRVYLGTTLVYEKATTPPPSGFTLPASTLMAYSVARAVDSSYVGNLIRVRRSTDNAELDIGVDGSGNLDEAALLAHTGTGTGNHGYITTLYEQTGNPNVVNFAQDTATWQPEIVVDGVVQKANGKPVALQPGVGGDHRRLTMTPWNARPANCAVFLIGSITAAFGRNSYTRVLTGTDPGAFVGKVNQGSTSQVLAKDTSTDPSFYANGVYIGTNRGGTTGDDLWTAYAEKGLVQHKITDIDFTLSTWTDLKTAYGNATYDGCYELPEMIFADAPSAADISAIEANQASFYGITL